ncbi:MAG TPA: hypothetical protein VHI78_09365 [Bacteroidales bacterium]|jgi:hypothetical protein|nr:hypothetical protein [Bacteroidales bacterium]
MRRILIVVLITIILNQNSFSQKSEVWMLGPMLHFNIADKHMKTSFGVELSYWNYEHFPYSFDVGIDFQKGSIRLYSEGQTGIGFLGLSFGPVLELRTSEGQLKTGIQGSVWANYFGGFDLRFRKTGDAFTFAPGLYFKLPVSREAWSYDGDGDGWDWDD